MNISINQLTGNFRAAAEKQLSVTKKTPAPIRGKKQEMNSWEEDFATQVLDVWKRAGEITWWGFNVIRIYIGPGAYYTPDFAVTEKSGETVIYEMKGFKRPAAIVRLKAAAGTMPKHRFVFVTKGSGGWEFTPVG